MNKALSGKLSNEQIAELIYKTTIASHSNWYAIKEAIKVALESKDAEYQKEIERRNKAMRELVRLEVLDVGRCESICNCGEEIYKQICDKLEV